MKRLEETDEVHAQLPRVTRDCSRMIMWTDNQTDESYPVSVSLVPETHTAWAGASTVDAPSSGTREETRPVKEYNFEQTLQ